MPRRPATLTSPAPSGAFLFLSSQPFNRAAQAPLNPRRGVPGPLFAPYLPPLVIHVRQTPSALPLSPFRPMPPRLGKAGAACRPVRPCRPSAGFPCPVPPFAAPCWASPSLAPSAAPPLARSNPFRRPAAGPVPPRKGGNRPPPVITVRAAAVRRRQNGGLRIKGK
jgi:hypothetical protein